MVATRLTVQILSALACAIFLLGFIGCPLDSNIDKIKEDAYKQGYEQGKKDNFTTQDSKLSSFVPSRELPTLGVPNRELPIPGKSYLPSLTPSEKTAPEIPSNVYIPKWLQNGEKAPNEMPKDFKYGRGPEDDPNNARQFEDKIRSLESQLRDAESKAQSARIESEINLYFERKRAEEAQWELERKYR